MSNTQNVELHKQNFRYWTYFAIYARFFSSKNIKYSSNLAVLNSLYNL